VELDEQIGPVRLNYFNYFTEVEEEFVRRRGKPLLISPLDWALVETWKDAGIPLHIVLRAINQAFDAHDARPRNFRKVNSLFYCQQEVDATFAEYRLAQVGGSQEPVDGKADTRKTRRKSNSSIEPFPREVLIDFIARCSCELETAFDNAVNTNKAPLSEAIQRARQRLSQLSLEIERPGPVDAEALESDFDSIDRMILEAANISTTKDDLVAMHAEAESQLRPHRRKMDKAIYVQTVENFVARRLRETNHLPRLSLFYL